MSALPPRLMKVLMAQSKQFEKDPPPNLLHIVDENDMRVWYFLIGGLDEPFQGGEYIFKLTAPQEFPEKPPSFEFCTNNGVFGPGGAICISVGEFHADSKPGPDGAYGWRPALGMKGFAIQVVNGMICHKELKGGIRIENTSNEEKRKLANVSREKNRKCFTRIYERFEEIIKTSPDMAPVRSIVEARNRLAAKPAASAAATSAAKPAASAAAAASVAAASAAASAAAASAAAATSAAATSAAATSAAKPAANAAAAAASAAAAAAVIEDTDDPLAILLGGDY